MERSVVLKEEFILRGMLCHAGLDEKAPAKEGRSRKV